MEKASPPVRLRLDPWPSEYESALQIDASQDTSATQVDPTVETANWRAITPAPVAAFETLYFIDGVRRVEARVLADARETEIRGLFGSTAVGCVRCCEKRALIEDVRVRRYLILSGGELRTESFRIGNADLRFEGHGVMNDAPDAALGQLQQLMRESEADLAESLAGPGVCVFVDGPLAFFASLKQEIVGIVKRIFLPYLDPPQFALAATLQAGQRTPLFSLIDSGKERYSWYLRLSAGRRIDHSLAGIVRLELRAPIGMKRAIEIADFAALTLPGYASTAAREPRAPQNLLPIGALEEELRHRLGDALLLRRAMEERLMDE